MWAGVGIIAFGVACVGCASMVGATANESDGDSTGDALFGVLMTLAGTFMQSVQYVYEEKVMSGDVSAPPWLLIGVEGDTITRNGAALLGLAYTLQAAENQAKRGSDNYMVKHMQDSLASLRKRLESDRNMLLPHGNAVDAAAKALDEGFARAADGDAKAPRTALVLKEMLDFVKEPELPGELKARLEAAKLRYEEAKAALIQVPVEDFDELRKTTMPSEAVTRAVRVICAIFDIRPDFAMAQQRLMRVSPEALRRRLLDGRSRRRWA
jgi:hypothetical protein